jgi:hypothetical protein
MAMWVYGGQRLASVRGRVAGWLDQPASSTVGGRSRTSSGSFGVAKFDYRRELRVFTDATIWIRQSIAHAIVDKSRVIRLPASVDQRLATLRRT